VTWDGEADISLGPRGGMETNGVREFNCDNGNSQCGFLHVYDINASNPPRNIAVWLPDPSSPGDTSLVGHIWHPTMLDRLRQSEWGFHRFMDMQVTTYRCIHLLCLLVPVALAGGAQARLLSALNFRS
jgi:hypothetical protein